MKSLFRAIRYSSVGVFFAGIISVLAGCTEREGVLGILLLVLLQFCSGPAAMPDPVPFQFGNPAIDGDVLLPPTFAAFNLCVDLLNPASLDGTITEWQIFLDAPTQLQLKVVRDFGGADIRVVAESALVNGVAGLNTFSTNIPGVEVGDFIGVWIGTPETVEASSAVTTSAACSLDGNVAPGTPITLFVLAPSGGISLQAKAISN